MIEELKHLGLQDGSIIEMRVIEDTVECTVQRYNFEKILLVFIECLYCKAIPSMFGYEYLDEFKLVEDQTFKLKIIGGHYPADQIPKVASEYEHLTLLNVDGVSHMELIEHRVEIKRLGGGVTESA